jgi:general stress protein YciG
MAFLPTHKRKRRHFIFTTNGGIVINKHMDKNQILKQYFSEIGRKGGSVKGSKKARTREHYVAMVNARWAKQRERQALSESVKTSGESVKS